MNKTKYTKDEVYQASLKYFNNDELATNVFMTKYCLKDNDNNFLELIPDDMHHRLASEFARVEKNKFENTEIDPLTENEIFNLFKDFKYIIPQGSPMFAIGNNYQLASSSNCYVLTPPEDSYGSIMYVDEELVQISKRRGGVGIDLSKLRPKGAKTNNAAKTSTGIIAFMERYSNSIREVGQEGRRGALLLSLDCRHPEIKEFITVKKDLTKITGANISVKISDDFMQAVHSNSEFELCFPVDYKERGIVPLHTEKIKAKELWNLLIHTSHETAEPGILFWDHQLNYSPANCYDQYRPVSTNPCAELALSPLESCRLISMNLTSYVRNPFSECARFDIELYHYHCMLAQRLSDDLIDIEDEIIDKIIAKIKNDPEDLKFKSREIEIWEAIKLAGTTGRRIGLGATGLADAIAMLNLSYSSDESIKQIDEIFKTLRNATYESSVELSRILGPFAGYDPKVEKDNLFIKQIKEEAPEIYNDMLKYGRRNVACNTMAPNGSLSLLAGGISSGIEPVFLLAYTRRRKLDSTSTETPDFIDPQGDRWTNFQIEHNTVKKWKTVTGETDIKNSPWFGSTANDLDWNKRIEIQSTIQKYIDHSISSCVVKDTLLETNKGLLYFDELTNLDELEEGQFVKNTESDILIRNKDDQFVPIDYFYKNGIKPVTKIRLKNNNQLICTDNESVLVYNEYINDLDWKMVKDLDIFDMVKISIGVN